jgi:putative sigma-54 modulation protein
MNYNIKGTSVDITDELRTYLEKKLSVLDKFLADDAGARVDAELGYLASEAKQYRAELMLHDKVQLRAEATGATLHEAMDIAVGELVQELTRAKKKRRSVFRHSAVKVKEYLRGWRSKL